MSGLLADLYSAGDRMKRKLGGLLSDPMGTIALGSQRMAEDTNALTRLVSEAGYMPNTVNRSDQSVLVSERQKALARALLADKGAEMGMAAATVWHGSPHKFDKFDSSKIGTGEGAQAYGHGLYLAESPSVAKSYADTLSQYHIGTRDGMKSGGDFADALVANAGDYPASLSSAIRSQANKVATDLAGGKTAEQVIASMRNGPYARMYAGLADAVEKMSPTKAGGSLYKVDLPDNAIARMLDWDKPLSQQHPDVQAAVKPLLKDMFDVRPYGGGWGSLEPDGAALRDVFTKSGHPLGAYSAADAEALNFTGSAIVKALGNMDKQSPATAQRLRQAGVPGIRYLDGGSRGAGQGSSNFVVFPGQEDILTILERNGVPIK